MNNKIKIKCKCGINKYLLEDKIINTYCKKCGEHLYLLYNKPQPKQEKLTPYLKKGKKIKEEEDIAIKKKERLELELIKTFLEEAGLKNLAKEIKKYKSEDWSEIDKILRERYVTLPLKPEQKQYIWIIDRSMTFAIALYKNIINFKSVKEYYKDGELVEPLEISYSKLDFFEYIVIGYSIISTNRLQKLLEILVKAVSKSIGLKSYRYAKKYNLEFRTSKRIQDIIFLYINTQSITKKALSYNIGILISPINFRNIKSGLEDRPVKEIIDDYKKLMNRFNIDISKITNFSQIKEAINIVKLSKKESIYGDYLNLLNFMYKYSNIKLGFIINKIIKEYDINMEDIIDEDEIPIKYAKDIFQASFNYTYKSIINKVPHKEYYYLIKNLIKNYYKFDINKFKEKIYNNTTFNDLIINIIYYNPKLLADSDGISSTIFNYDYVGKFGYEYQQVIKLIFFLYNHKFDFEESIIALEYTKIFDSFEVDVIKYIQKGEKTKREILGNLDITIGEKESHQYNRINGSAIFGQISVLTNIELGKKYISLEIFERTGYKYFKELLKKRQDLNDTYNTKYFKKVSKLFKDKDRIIIKYIDTSKHDKSPLLVFIYRNIYIYLAGR